jgi:hypothetical protein
MARPPRRPTPNAAKIGAALAQATTWIEADPTRADWVDSDVAVWPGPDYPAQSQSANLAGLAPNGVVETTLVRDLPGRPGVIGSAWVDPWTGEVVSVTTG